MRYALGSHLIFSGFINPGLTLPFDALGFAQNPGLS